MVREEQIRDALREVAHPELERDLVALGMIKGIGVQNGRVAVLSHKSKINFLRGDGSVDTFNVKRLEFDPVAGPERLQDVSLRYGVCFPTIMLHRWLANDQVNLDEAREFLSDPQGWANRCSTLVNGPACRAVSEPILLARVSKKSLASDVVGVWGAPPPSG